MEDVNMRIPVITLAAVGIAACCLVCLNNVNKTKSNEETTFQTLAQDVSNESPSVVKTMMIPVAPVTSSNLENVEEYTSPYNFDELHAANEEIIAWVNIPDTSLDYPIVFNGTEDYLHQDLNKENSYSGTPFLDEKAENPMKDFVNIIYGHHMKDGSMFSAIDDYNDAVFFEAHNEINIYLENETLNLHPVATITGKADAAIRTIQSIADLKAFAEDKDITVGAIPSEISELYVFVTCNYSGKDFRTYLICTK